MTTRWEALASDVHECARCVLREHRLRSVIERGARDARLMFVGEAPGSEEDRQGLPFVGPAGKLLDDMIRAMKLDPTRDVYVCNVVKCRPPSNRTPNPDEIASCLHYLHMQIGYVDPQVIVPLGAVAARALLRTDKIISHLRGQWTMTRWCIEARPIPTMPTYHPAYCLRQPSAKYTVWKDLKEVMQRL